MKIMAINPGHNGSVALVEDGKLLFYSEEERWSRLKYDGNPFRAMLWVLTNHLVDHLIIGGTTTNWVTLPWTNENAYAALARKFSPNVQVTLMGHLHHLGHAANAFYGSGFETACALVVDGAGSYVQESMGEGLPLTGGFETESIYHCSYPHEFNAVYKRYSDGAETSLYYDNGIQEFDNNVTIVKAYESVSDYLGFGAIEAGKTMGLAPYGQEDSNIPAFFINNKGNKNLLIPRYPSGAHIDENRFPYLRRYTQPSDWHNNFELVRDQDKNLAYHVQKETEEQMVKLIERAIDITGENRIVISGGYALNCVANYKYLERFPNIEFYIDPIAHDGGTAIGLARHAYYVLSQDTTPQPLSHLYLSVLPDYNQIETTIASVEGISMRDTSPAEVALLLAEGNIVALFQGASEGGPRALGNRSILFDPRVTNGKDIVNQVKNREWFRPFAASVMAEHANDWFDMRNLNESPYMMYAVNVKESQRELIPAVTHVDGTCRVQTVTSEQNLHLYQLLDAFRQQTETPLLFNTSFNLAGQPLVETLVDALITIFNCDIHYLYLPDLGMLVCKQ
jgi:carbamoyltransferase